MSPESSEQFVLYRVEDKVAFITLNRPEVLNAMNEQVEEQLFAAFERFDADEDAWVAVLSGNGKHFCAGADVKAKFQPVGEDAAKKANFQKMLRGSTGQEKLGRTVNWKPVIAAVHGYCLGSGFAWALESDLLVAAESTQFGIAETKRGLTGARVWARLQTFMPSKIATEMLLFGDRYPPADLYRLGAINRLVEDGTQLQVAEELARKLLLVPPLAVRSGVRVSRRLFVEAVDQADYYAAALRLHLTEDYRESSLAFKEKRPPIFHAR